MDRRRFVGTTLKGVGAGVAFGGAAFEGALADAPLRLLPGSPPPRLQPGERADLVLRGGFLLDGSGAPGRDGDVAITGDRIVEVGEVARSGLEEIDVRGLALAPGFIDIHSHADLELLREPRAESRIRQGVTVEVVGQDGGSNAPRSAESAAGTRERYMERYDVEVDLRTLAGFFDAFDRHPTAVNVASMVGHGTLRGLVVGGADRPATDEEIERMQALVRQAIADGAVGLSSGLEYTPGSFAPTSELVALAAAMRGTGYPYASHMRNEDDRLLAAVEEALHVGRMAEVPVQISHLKAQGQRNYWKGPAVLDLIEAARASGVDVHFDRYPYVAYATGLTNLFPTWSREGGTDAFRERLQDPADRAAIERFTRDKVALLGSWDAVQISSISTDGLEWLQGRKLGEAAAERGVDPFELAVRILEEGSAGMIGYGMSEENTEGMLAHPLGMVCSDGGAFAPYGPLSSGSPHPRAYGTFPRLLGHYVRDRGIMPLERAVHKITAMPAAKLQLRDRGLLRPGAFADVVAFDPDTVADGATFTDPHQYPTGIPHVVVNGSVTLRDGEQTERFAGRAVRGGA